MGTVIATSTAPEATAYSNQRVVDRCQNGVLWMMFWDGTSTTSTSMDFAYSTDNGATWTVEDGFGFFGTDSFHTPHGSFFIDVDDYAHVVYKDRANGNPYYRRGTPNASRTSWTWSSAVTIYSNPDMAYPDVVAHPEGTGWRAHVVMSYPNTDACYYVLMTIGSGGSISAGSLVNLGSGYSSDHFTRPSIDFNHTGDGKTIANNMPHLYAAWSGGVTGAGAGIRFKKATYSGGLWSWGAEQEIDSTRYVPSDDYYVPCLFDGTRVIIGGMVSDGVNDDLILHERDASDTTTTSRTLLNDAGTSITLLYGSMTYDGDKNVHFIGRHNDEAAGTHDLVHRKWIRSTTTLEAETVIDNGVGATPYVSAKRGAANDQVEFVYTDGTAPPYDVAYGSVILGAVTVSVVGVDESEVAQPVFGSPIIKVESVAETETSNPSTVSSQISIPILSAEEVNTLQTPSLALAVNPVTETELAFSSGLRLGVVTLSELEVASRIATVWDQFHDILGASESEIVSSAQPLGEDTNYHLALTSFRYHTHLAGFVHDVDRARI